jgi:DNA mismatch repair protein MutS
MSDETPLLRQYRAIKAEHPGAILMFRIGDFYEMLEADAETAARELELTLTSKALGKAGRLPLAGVPHHAVDNYIARLVRKGYHVAVCDQTEDPRQAKGLVKREVLRVVTPGTLGDSDARQNKFLAALFEHRPADRGRRDSDAGGAESGAGWVLAVGDLLTGELYAGDCPDRSALEGTFARFRPDEVLVPEGAAERATALLAEAAPGAYVTRLPDWRFGPSYAEDLLRTHFGVATLEGFGLAQGAPESGAAAALLSYLKETQKSSLAHVTSLKRLDASEIVTLDASTLLGLEIVDSPTRDREATLLKILDQAVTAMGSRLIARRITSPLKSPEGIRARLELVEAFHSDALARADVRVRLRKVYDIERLAGRLSLGTITPREVVGLAASLEAVPTLRDILMHGALSGLRNALDPVPELSALIRARIVDEPPLEIGESPLFRDGVSPELDALRHGSRDSRQWIAELQQKERERSGIGSLKVGFNSVFGYYIEVTRSNLPKVPADYVRKQTTAAGERYFTEELKNHEDVVLRANERIAALESSLFAGLRIEIAAFLPRVQFTAAAIAELDLSAAFAEVAAQRNYTRPEILDESRAIFRIEKGRHPVVEALLSGAEGFVPNETLLERESRFMLLTGPNMAGKSTYIRQVAAIALMAQIGSFVPAERCALTPFESLHARIGASDRLARGLSTFMVEMVEAALILRTASARSLVILDEIGRGTSTYDGLSIAWAMVEALAGRGTLTLFATHYHELTALPERIPGVFNATVAVKEWGEKIHFLHEIRPGAADRSYGIQVAAIAGVPKPVIARAKEVLAVLEMGELSGGGVPDERQLSLFAPVAALAPGEEEALKRLRAVDADALSPRDALALLAELREKLG